MTKKLLLALLVVAVMAMPAFAAVQNVKVSGNVDSTYIYRNNFDLGTGTNSLLTTNQKADRVQNFFITQTRVRVDADLSDNVSTVVSLLNERSWGVENDPTTDSNDVDLDLAYVTLREMLYSPLTVHVGRQPFKYGNSLIVDSTGPNNSTVGPLALVAADLNKRSGQDAIRLVLDYKPLTIDMLYWKVDSNTVAGVLDTHILRDEVDLYGINGNYELGDSWNTVAEAYFFVKNDQSTRDSVAGAKDDRIYVPGLRASTNPVKGLNVQGEMAWQRGTKVSTTASAAPDNEQREAFAAQVIANYDFQVEKLAKYKPTAMFAYTYASGDKNGNTLNDKYLPNSAEKYTAWDPMFESQAGGKIYNALFDLSNCHIYTVSGGFNLIEDLKLSATWTGLWTAKHDQIAGNGASSTTVFNMRQPDQAQIQPWVTNKGAIGQEIDADLTYNYTEDVSLGASLGMFLPGDFFVSRNDSTATQALVSLNVAF